MEYRGPERDAAAVEGPASPSAPMAPAKAPGSAGAAAPTTNEAREEATTAEAAAGDEAAADLCFSSAAAVPAVAAEMRERAPPPPSPPPSPLEVSTTVVVQDEAPTPVLNRSLIGSPYELHVNFLDVMRDTTFPEVRVLRIKLHGVLFFGSCMEFVDGMVKMLHEHHNEIFLKVTDFILDFQHGLMPVLDFSAAEAIQNTANILAKRGIRTHVQNMDPLSWACFDRIRRYFPDVCEDDVNNAKQHCYVRRIFKIVSRHEMLDGGNNNTDVDVLDDDVFLRGNRSFVRSTAATAEKDDTAVTPGVAPPSSSLSHSQEAVPPAAGATATEPTASAAGAATADAAAVAVPLSATEECVPFCESVKVGFPIYRPELGITVPVFDTISRWAQRTTDDIQGGRTPALEIGLTSAKPIDRQFGDIGPLWWKRLLNLDIPAWVRDGSPTPEVPHATTQRSPEVPLRRPVPEHFEQIARFPGQGFAKGERLHQKEWADIQSCVYRQVFAVEPPPQPNRFVARIQQARKELVDGFI